MLVDVKKRLAIFQDTVWQYYRAHGRHDLPWRRPERNGTPDPYKVLVSEIMLQQTQVPRVIAKFTEFVRQFPSFEALAEAPLAEVLRAWSGLGYNRRAKFLWQAAGLIVRNYGGELPRASVDLIVLPGIGTNTAGALLAYAYNQPVVFIETNIRTVFIHHFFADATDGVHDRDIADLVAATLPDNPREWYWALMDYGTHLKQTVGNLSRASAHYTVQSRFEGSRRQIRGQVLKQLGSAEKTLDELRMHIADERLEPVLRDLEQEGLITRAGAAFKLQDA
jgi:A/G-specific adenine glycosylase